MACGEVTRETPCFRNQKACRSKSTETPNFSPISNFNFYTSTSDRLGSALALESLDGALLAAEPIDVELSDVEPIDAAPIDAALEEPRSAETLIPGRLRPCAARAKRSFMPVFSKMCIR